MATRNFPEFVQTNILKRVDLFCTYAGVGTGTAAPTALAGDPKGAFLAAPVYVNTGIFSVTTIDPYPSVVGYNLEYVVASASATTSAVISPIPVQNANGTWTFTINCFTAGSLTNPITTSIVSLQLSFANTGDPYAG